MPLAHAWVISPYGPRGRKFHTGIDLKASPHGGDPITAARAGQVVKIGHRGGYGNMVLLRHADGTMTRYAHMRRVEVRLGQSVAAGAEIGRVGGTGHTTTPHLHFEILLADKRTVNPAPYILKN
jgi:murein DD-endopeptidase MepM/ murein hydrolase activator NlpD